MKQQTVKVEGMSCDGCANSVKSKFESLSGVSNADINLDSKSADVKTDRILTAGELKEALEDTPYEVVEEK